MFFSAVGSFSVIWIVLGIILIVIEEKKHHEFVLFFLGGLIVTAVLTSFVIKPVVHRSRPSFANAIAKPADYSFPSTHAATSFFAATLLTFYHRKKKALFYTLAGLISFSRLYLGVHYAGDVLAGAIIGILIAYAISNFQFTVFSLQLNHGVCTISQKRGHTKKSEHSKRKR
ncbi:MAG: phosphatase PAP2 family protein [Patescibacteria group bacterium]